MQYLRNNSLLEIPCSQVGIASGGGRTHNLWLRRPTLNPIELRTQSAPMIIPDPAGVKLAARLHGARSESCGLARNRLESNLAGKFLSQSKKKCLSRQKQFCG